jgi:hypothetical protein
MLCREFETFHSIRFSESCSIVQNFYSFFVGTAHERPRIIAVESMSIDGQQVTTISHCIAEKRQVTIIDISAEVHMRNDLTQI